MEIVYKNPEVEMVTLGVLTDGTIFKPRDYNHLYLRLCAEGSSIKCYDMTTNHMDAFTDDTIVRPYKDVKLLVITPAGG